MEDINITWTHNPMLFTTIDDSSQERSLAYRVSDRQGGLARTMCDRGAVVRESEMVCK